MVFDDSQPGSINWQAVIFALTGKMDGIANKKYGEGVLAEELCAKALEKLCETDYQQNLAARYQGKVKPESYILSCFHRLLADFHRVKFQRIRPPAWLSRLGVAWEKIYRLLCLERQEPEQIVTRLGDQDVKKEKEIHDMISIIRIKVVHCGAQRGEVGYDFELSTPDQDGNSNRLSGTIENHSERETVMDVFKALSMVLACQEGDGLGKVRERHTTDEVKSLLGAQVEKGVEFTLDLSGEERLLLRVVYQDGKKISEVARLLNIPRHQIDRKLKDCLSRLKKQLQNSGMNVDILRTIMG